VQLSGAELTAHAAQVVAAPTRRTQVSSGPRGTTDEAAFLASLDGDAYRDAFHDFLAACSALGLVLAWGSKGLSIRIPTPDRNEPLSIAWGLPDGAQWQGLRHLSVGVDRASLAQTPSLVDPIERYIAAVEAVPGGRHLNTKMAARTFDASTAPSAVPALIDAVAALVREVNEPG